MQEHQLPELQRCPLEELCLVARLVDPTMRLPLADFIAKAPEPPLPQAVALAVTLLQDIGALTAEEELTTLGRHLAALPLPPQLGKLILYGLLFQCLDAVVAVACAMSYRCHARSHIIVIIQEVAYYIGLLFFIMMLGG